VLDTTADRAAILDWLKSTKRDPSSVLGTAITRAALSCAQVVEPELKSSSDKERETRHVFVMWEYFCFFMHMGGRAAQTVLGDVGASQQFCQKLAGQLVPLAVQTTFMNATPSLKERLETDLWAMLDESEGEYSECKQLYIKGDLVIGEGLFNKLGKRVAEACGNPTNPITIMNATTAAVDCWTKMEMEKLVLF
jgi:hypothetical protein